MYIYHASYRVADSDGSHTGLAGVCAANKTDAARLAHERLTIDGWHSVRIDTVKSVARSRPGDTWTPGNVLIYT